MDNDLIMDGENYRNTKTGSYKDIVLGQVKKIVTIYSSEMTAGFKKFSQPNQFGIQEAIGYVPDGRKSYCQAVEVLYDLLYPKFNKDKVKENTKEILDGMHTEFKNCKKNWLEKKVKIMRKVFQELCIFLESLGWLDDGDSEE